MDDSLADHDTEHEQLNQLKRLIPSASVASYDDSHQFYGDRVLKHDTAAGDKIAIEFKRIHWSSDDDGIQTEADMIHYAATHGVLAPKVRAVYDIHTVSSIRPSASAMDGDRVSGDRLSEVWSDLSDDARSSIVARPSYRFVGPPCRRQHN